MVILAEKQEVHQAIRLIVGEQPNIYPERSGKGSRRLVETLLEAPEYSLSPEETEEALAYEAELCELPVSTDLTLERMFKQHKGEDLWAPKFFAKAFLNGQVQVPGYEGVIRQHRTPEDVYAWLAQAAADQSIDPSVLTDMARQSGVYYRTEMQQALLRGKRPDEQLMSAMPIVLDPKKILHFAEAGMHARDYLHEQRITLKNKIRGVDGAKRAFLEIYTKRLNGLIAGDIVNLQYLIEQSELIDDTETVVDSYNAMPAMLAEIVKDHTLRPSLNKRLDYIKNGIGYDESGKATAVDEALFAGISNKEDMVATVEPVFSAEQKETLRATMVSPDEMYKLFEDVLDDAGMLSIEDASTWAVGRGKRAEDELYQVVHHPTKDTFAVNATDGVIMVPNNARSLYDVLTVGVHELTHINQGQADREIGRYVRIGVLKGRRVSMLRETGANLVQRELEQELFGESKPIALGYAKAVQVIEAGGDVYDATKAFFEEKLANNTDVGASELAKEAADRVLRLMLAAGTNSQPLSYAEEIIMHRELDGAPPEVRQRATLITTLDLDDQIRLHRYGLLPTPEQTGVNWTQFMLQRIQPLIQQALRQSSEAPVHTT